jgi:hypothetical protein
MNIFTAASGQDMAFLALFSGVACFLIAGWLMHAGEGRYER